MKIILLENVKNLGNKYDVKEIKNGYARNFLIPRKLAKIASKNAIKELEFQKAKQQLQEKEFKTTSEELVERLKNKKFEFNLKIGEKKEVFGSVNKEEIKKSLAEKGIEAEVLLDKPLKILGEHQIKINLKNGVKTTIIAQILPE